MKLKKFILPILFSLELAGCSFSLPSLSNKNPTRTTVFDDLTKKDDFYDYKWPNYNPDLSEIRKNDVGIEKGIKLLEPYFRNFGYSFEYNDGLTIYSEDIKGLNTENIFPNKAKAYYLFKGLYIENTYLDGEFAYANNETINKAQSINFFDGELDKGFISYKGSYESEGLEAVEIPEELETIENRDGAMLSIRKNAEMKDDNGYIDANFFTTSGNFDDYARAYLFRSIYDTYISALNDLANAESLTRTDVKEYRMDYIFSYDEKDTLEVTINYELETDDGDNTIKRIGECYFRFKTGFLLGGYRKAYESNRFKNGYRVETEVINKSVEYFEGFSDDSTTRVPTIELNHSDKNHTYSNNFTFNDTKHFKKCVAPGCDYAIESQEHRPCNCELLEIYEKDGYIHRNYAYTGSGTPYCECGFKMPDDTEFPEDLYVHGHNPNFEHYGADENSHWYMCNTVINGRYCNVRMEQKPHIFSKIIEEDGLSYKECYECGYKLYIQ